MIWEETWEKTEMGTKEHRETIEMVSSFLARNINISLFYNLDYYVTQSTRNSLPNFLLLF